MTQVHWPRSCAWDCELTVASCLRCCPGSISHCSSSVAQCTHSKERKESHLLNIIYSSQHHTSLPPLNKCPNLQFLGTFGKVDPNPRLPEMGQLHVLMALGNYILSKWNRILKGFIVVVKNSQPLQITLITRLLLWIVQHSLQIVSH